MFFPLMSPVIDRLSPIRLELLTSAQLTVPSPFDLRNKLPGIFVDFISTP